MKTLKELKGAKELSKKEQKAIGGGKMQCLYNPTTGLEYCPAPYTCVNGICILSIEA
jgi:hypothetical protein